MSISKFNKSKGPRYTFRAGDDFKFYKLADLASLADTGKTIPLMGMFVSEGKFGFHATLITDMYYVNLPAHMTDTVRAIMDDDEVTEQINRGEAGFTIYSYESSSGRTAYSVKFCDLPKLPY